MTTTLLNNRTATTWRIMTWAFAVMMLSWTAHLSAQSTSEEIKQTVDTAVDRAQELSSETKAAIEERNPVARSPGAIVGWILIGAMVGSIAGVVLGMKKGGILSLLANVAMGCIGAFVGGVIVQVAKLDWGWGSLSVPYEELVVSFAVSVVVIVVIRSILTRMAVREPEKK